MAIEAVSVVVPTLREVENLPELTARLGTLRSSLGLKLELLVMDDGSRDGTVEWVRDEAPDWVELVVRTEDHGLARAVLDGVERARHPVVVVMDADLSHPPESVPTMLAALDDGYEMVVGSRYVAGAGTDEEWHWVRALNSRVATLLARPLTRVCDPMAGFLAFRRDLLADCDALDPVGFKIGLEMIVKCGIDRVREVPIRFATRRAGSSKLNLGEQVLYLRHLLRLYRYRLGRRGRRRAA